MRFLGFGARGGIQESLGAIIDALSGDGVSDEAWQDIVAAPDLEDHLEDALPFEKLRLVLCRRPEQAATLCERCVVALEQSLPPEAGHPGEEHQVSDEAAVALTNAALLLARLLAASGKDLQDALWLPVAVAGRALPRALGERMADATLRALFLDGFTVDAPKDQEAPELVDGVDPGLLWADGVGPEGGSVDKLSDDMRENRRTFLLLLASVICGGAPMRADVGSAEDLAARSDKQKLAAASEAASKAALPMIADDRPLEYLSCPGRSVPYRGELLFSLLSMALSYDPHGFGVPYAGYFTGKKDEETAHLCLQVAGLLLQGSEDTSTDQSSAWACRRPQEQPGDAGRPLPQQGAQAFRQLIAGISSEREISFIVSGVVTLIGTAVDERNTYLPSSMRVPPFLPELLVLVFHLSVCDAFVLCACEQGDLSPLVEGILHVSGQAPEHVEEDIASVLTWATLLRLSAYREVCIAFNDDFTGDTPDDTPDFTGSVADLVFISGLGQISDCFATARVSSIHRFTSEMALCTMANVSIFTEELSTATCGRFFALLERCAKSVQGKRSRGGAQWLPYLLEILEYIVQYQYPTNTRLAYGMANRFSVFRELQIVCAEPVDRIVNADGRTSKQSGNVSPQSSECSFVGDALSEEVVSRWQQDLKVHLDPIMVLLDDIVPQLEAEVEKRDTVTSDEAKDMLPKSVLGLLPAPPAFVMRGLRYNMTTHRACERCLVLCVAHGPIASAWETDEAEEGGADASAGAEEAADERAADKKGVPAGAESGRAFSPLPRAGGAKRSSSSSRGRAAADAAATATTRAVPNGGPPQAHAATATEAAAQP